SDWAKATEPFVSEGMVYGCGACDVKGFLACLLTSVAEVTSSALTGGLRLVWSGPDVWWLVSQRCCILRVQEKDTASRRSQSLERKRTVRIRKKGGPRSTEQRGSSPPSKSLVCALRKNDTFSLVQASPR